MTQYDQSQKPKSHHERRFQRLVRALCLAGVFGGVVALANDAQAEQRCTSKPAVCALNKSKRENQPKPAADTTRVKETKKVVRVKRCTSKPAVCAVQRATNPQTVTTTQVVRKKPAVKRCTSKPAVCALQRSYKAAKAK